MKLFALNIGSTSTKVALFEGMEKLFEGKVEHDAAELMCLPSIMDQKEIRAEGIRRSLEEAGFSLEGCAAIVARCGGTGPIPGGTYRINDTLIRRLTDPSTRKHNADLGGVLADLLAKQNNCAAYFVDSPETDELQPLARLTGMKGSYKVCSTHTLNQKAVCRFYAAQTGRRYQDLNLVVAHIGGGVSVSAHRKGSIIDSTNLIRGDGPMAPTRCGEMQAMTILDLAFSGQDRKELEKRINMSGGLMDHLGTADVMEIKKRIESGDTYAKYVYDGMIYQIGKYIGMMGTVLEGQVDAILLTGGISRDEYLTGKLKKMCGYLAPVEVIAGEFEMEALAAGAYRVLTGEEEEKEYREEFTFTGIEDLLKKLESEQKVSDGEKRNIENTILEEKMSLVTEAPAEYGAAKKKYTIADIYALPDGVRAELIDGNLHYMATPTRTHQKLAGEIYLSVANYIKAHDGSCEVYISPFAVYLFADESTYLEPDLTVVCDTSKLDEKGCWGAPDWVVEVLSPATGSKDMGLKRNKYKAAGVREYWIIDPEKKVVIVYLFGKEDKEEVTLYSFEDQISCSLFPDLVIQPSALLWP